MRQVNIISIFKKHRWLLPLLIITAVAIFIRTLPALVNAAWGVDFGIYYGLTNSFVETKSFINPYNGWGSSYQFFPVLYIITGITHFLTGIETIQLLPKIAPIFGGLTVLIFYFFAKKLVEDKKIALTASLLLAVSPLHAYQTSHPYPLVMGHFFMMLSLYFLLQFKSTSDYRYWIPLLFSTGLLILSHHLTTYFYIITLASIFFIENAHKKEWTTTVIKDIFYILTTSMLTFSYWIFVAKPVYESFMKINVDIAGVSLSSHVIIILFYVLFFFMIGVLWFKKRYNIFFKYNLFNRLSPRFIFYVTFIPCFSIMLLFNFINLPGTNYGFTPLSILYSIPILIMFSFSAIGLKYIKTMKNGLFISGWTFGLIISFLYGVFSNSSILPHRHFEYLIIPFCILSIYGVKAYLECHQHRIYLKEKTAHLHFDLSLVKKIEKGFKIKEFMYIIIIIILVSTNAASIYSFHTAMNITSDEISNENFSVFKWMNQNLDKNKSVIASDHRLCRIIESEGFNTTIDEAFEIWSTENLSEYIEELSGTNRNYTKITHIVIDDIMKEKVVNPAFKKTFYMTNVSYEKFHELPFELLYRNASYYQDSLEEKKWTEIYKVNWTYLEMKEMI